MGAGAPARARAFSLSGCETELVVGLSLSAHWPSLCEHSGAPAHCVLSQASSETMGSGPGPGPGRAMHRAQDLTSEHSGALALLPRSPCGQAPRLSLDMGSDSHGTAIESRSCHRVTVGRDYAVTIWSGPGLRLSLRAPALTVACEQAQAARTAPRNAVRSCGVGAARTAAMASQGAAPSLRLPVYHCYYFRVMQSDRAAAATALAEAVRRRSPFSALEDGRNLMGPGSWPHSNIRPGRSAGSDSDQTYLKNVIKVKRMEAFLTFNRFVFTVLSMLYLFS